MLNNDRRGVWVPDRRSRCSLVRDDRIHFQQNFRHQPHLRILAARGARGFTFRCPSKGREQGMPDARCTRGLVCKLGRETAHERTGQRRTSDIPCAMALRLISRSPRGIGLSCPRRLRIAGSSVPGRADLPSADLTPTSEASGPHDFTVRSGTARQRILKTSHGVYPALLSHRAHDALASTASHPNVR